MGAKPSKSSNSDDYRSSSSSNLNKKNNNKRKTSHNLRAVLSPSSSSTSTSKQKQQLQTKTTKNAATVTADNNVDATLLVKQTKEKQQQTLPPSCTTIPTIKSQHKLPNVSISAASTSAATSSATSPPITKRSSPCPSSTSTISSSALTHYDPLNSSSSKKPKRRKNSSSTSKQQMMNNNNNSDSAFYSNISSGWTTLSNDPFSQIEAANTSTFTEVTDQSTISRKSLYPAAAAVNNKSCTSLLLAPPYYNNNNTANNCLLHAMTAQGILNQLATSSSSYDVIKEAYERAQQQNDPYDWTQFYLAMEQYNKTKVNSIGIVYLARCLIAGLGTTINIERGIELLKSNPSCETTYALGHCYLDGSLSLSSPDVDRKTAAFNCFSDVVSTYADNMSTANESIQSTVAEAQCTMARMLFQGQGVQQNTSEALKLLMQSAENNNMYAQFLIGVHYERGFDMAQDLEKAKYYYEKSADQGFPDAQAALASRLISELDYAKGIEWLEKAVQMGNSRAHVQLGILYDKGGQGVVQNHDLALLHYKAAVEHGNHAAQYILGLVYYFGRLGRQKNHKEAVRLIKQSAMAGLPYAQRVLGQLYQQGSIQLQDGTVAESRTRTKKNEREAIRWYKRAAAGKDVSAMGILGKCHELGTGVEVDFERALAFYAKAAEQDSPYVCNAQIDQALLLQKMARHQEAFRLYSLILQRGDPIKDRQSIQTAQLSVARYHLCHDVQGVQYDPVLAHNMLLALVETTNDPHAHYWLGSIYDEGIPGLFEIDRQKAFHHFLIAAEGGDNDAAFLVAYMMSNHVIPNKGPADAFPWYQKAASQGHRMSMYSVGLCYYKGIGLDQPHLDQALEWFEKSARLGVVEAMSYMSRMYLQYMVSCSTNHQPVIAQQHFVKAVHWLKHGCEKNDTYCQRELGKIYLTGKGLTADHRLAFDLLQKASLKNDPEAITFLGDCYHKGTGVEKNMEIAIEHYLRAASLGYPFAYSAAAELYYEFGNMEYAYDYYLLASKQPKIANNKIGKTARMMVARLSLGYIPLNNPTLLQPLFNANKTLSPEESFAILSTLSIQDQFPQAFQPLGLCYLHGTGTDMNAVQAIFWFRKSAQELNDSIALFNLAEIYTSSGGLHAVTSDVQLGLSYLGQSADMGYTEAQYRMGMIYLHGEFGIHMDERTAAHWFKLAASKLHVNAIWSLSEIAGRVQQPELELQYQKKAASLGHVVAMRVLGEKYLKQLEQAPFLNALMQQEYLEQALNYLHRASDAGDTVSLVLLGKAYNNCIKTKVKFSASSPTSPTNKLNHLPTPSDTHNSFTDDELPGEEEGESRFQCEEDEKNLAIECFERASALGDIDATVYAAEAWYEQKQYAAALEYFEKAASQGNVLARFFCARYCIEAYGGSQLNPEKGFQELLICANELNCVHAFNNLGQCYENGIGTMKNDQLAFEWYCRAAEITHDAEAYYRIAQMYAQGRIPTQLNKDMEACRVYDLAVNATPDNHGPSCYQLGLYYLKGILDPSSDQKSYLLPPDICLSVEYFRTAADLNVQKAMLQLGILFLNDDYTLEEQEEGLSRLQHAAELGLREAQFELGLFYHRGKEVVISCHHNEEEEEEDGSQRRHDDDEENPKKEEHDGVEECILIPQDFEKAYDLFCRSAAQKHPTATYYLGIYHQHGIFVAPDLNIALEQYEIAVELFEKYDTAPDRWQAEFNLARILHQDVESRVHAYELFQSAHLHAPEQYKFLSEIMIARYHLFGWANVAIQAEEAAATLIRFAQEEEKFGYRVYLQVAECYELGLGIPKDLCQAFHWYGEVVSKAHILISANDNSNSAYDVAMIIDEEIEEDEACAMFKLAEFYRKGLVVAQDIKKADDLYRLAARKGSLAAQEYLSYMLQKTILYD